MRFCQHFSICGGCQYQDIPYFEQLKMKESQIKDMIDFFELSVELKPINSYREWFYRNKMEFTFGKEDSNLICGLHRKKEKRELFNLRECLIFSPCAEPILNKVREVLKDRYLPYEKFSHRGFLRHLVIRETKFTDEIMIALVTTTQDKLDQEEFVKELVALKLEKKISSLFWILNDRVSDAVIFEEKRLLWGQPFITEKIANLNFRIFVDSFFQTNSYGITHLYKKIEEYAQLTGEERVLDLYCGVGSIGLFLARRAKFVWGVEIKKEIVENAIVNAQLNGIENISFICSDVKKFLVQKDISNIDIVVINPPRCGLSKKIKKYLLKMPSPRIFYSSCNPYTLFTDLKDFSSLYRIVFIEPFDFFPHTPHLECLAFLERKN
ncbi:MAG TPA: 23S rRNA (uracil(1939)-C(5))-methyltransferase RlmD [Candidatus Omnitrophica bacterium]|nr:23S rRNA (uracil(1939)-C(5))-methyltransferase RlmD [Candidatus Omnitrophota bacterium]